MSSDQTWVEALKISPESLSDWSMQAPSGTPLLVWCITNGHVNPLEYLTWARDHYGIAVLDSRFFTAEFKKENLQGLRDQAPWCAWCFPIGEWDGVTFVACAEPPSEMHEGHFAFVLADPSAMAEVWAENGISQTMLDAPVGINLEAQNTFVLNLDDNVIATAHAHAVEPAPVEKKDDESTSLTLSVIHIPENTMAAPKTPPTPPAPPKPAMMKTATQPAPAPSKPAPPAPKVTDITSSFEHLHEMYEAVMVLQCGDGVAKPYQWDKHLPIVEGDSKYSVNLSYPGFLRIVAKTMQPYHGYVIDSPAHREFFENLNLKELPACVSAIPLKTGEKLWGILVAFGGNAAKPPEALNEALTAGEKIGITLGLQKPAHAA